MTKDVNIRADWVLPVTGQPVRNSVVTVRDGRIASISPGAAATQAAVTKATAHQKVIDLGTAILMPGFVNAHTHLELTCYDGAIDRPPPDGEPLFNWLMNLIRTRKAGAPPGPDSVLDGAERSLRAGVTCVGDISRTNFAWAALKQSPIRKVCFAELITIANRPPRTMEELRKTMAGMTADDRLTIGVSPHAPYSVREDHLRACFALAAEQGFPATTHWAECRSEVEFLAGRPSALDEYHHVLARGSFVSPKMKPMAYLQSVASANQPVLLAHMNYLDASELATLADSPWSVAYCPRTHAFFHHKNHPFRDMLAAGVNVCAATDSLASNPSLSVLDELRFLRHRHPDLNPSTLLAMGTINGAKALGLDEQIGSIEKGKWADLVAVPLSHDPLNDPVDDPIVDLLDGNRNPTWTMVGGDVVIS